MTKFLATFIFIAASTSSSGQVLGAETDRILAVMAARLQQLEAINPAGVVQAYAGVTTPQGWLPCDGKEYLKASYPQLYTAIGDVYATQINAATKQAYPRPADDKFRVPDYRGSFLRAAGPTQSADDVRLGVFQEDATNKNGLAATNSRVTSGTESQSHTHIDSTGHNHGLADENGNGAFGWDGGTDGGGMYYFSATKSSRKYQLKTTVNYVNLGNASQTHTHDMTTNVSLSNGDLETRPQNIGVNYMIRAR